MRGGGGGFPGCVPVIGWAAWRGVGAGGVTLWRFLRGLSAARLAGGLPTLSFNRTPWAPEAVRWRGDESAVRFGNVCDGGTRWPAIRATGEEALPFKACATGARQGGVRPRAYRGRHAVSASKAAQITGSVSNGVGRRDCECDSGAAARTASHNEGL